MARAPVRPPYRVNVGGRVEVRRGGKTYRLHIESLRRLSEQRQSKRTQRILENLSDEYVRGIPTSILAITNPGRRGTVKIEWGYGKTGRAKVVEHADKPGNLLMLSGGWPRDKIAVRTRDGRLVPLLSETQVRKILSRKK